MINFKNMIIFTLGLLSGIILSTIFFLTILEKFVK